MGGNSSKESNVDYYTCTMHPSVHKKDPGKCPICSMDLVPVLKKGAESSPSNAGSPTSERKIKYYKSTMMAGETNSKPAKDSMNMDMVPVYEDGTTAVVADSQPSEFTVPAERQQQIGVQFATVERKPLHHSVRAVGMLETDKGRDWQFVARVDGYVQKLFVTSPGEIVEKDAPLMSIYSPELLTTERELVQLLGMRDRAPSREARETPEKLIDAAKRRLRQWYVTDEQLAELEKSRTPSDNLTLLSPFRGVVQAVPVVQGKSVKMGDALVDVADLAVVWAWAEFYENEVSMLEKGQKVTVTAKSYPGEKFEGTISLINPFMNETTRTAKVRIDIPNPDFKLRPGMYVNAELGMDMGEALTVAVSAIMPTGTRNVVFVDKGEGKLEPRVVELGAKFGDSYEVKDGLKEGERVVSSANFLIDAESKVQGALKSFEESGKEESRN